VYDRTAVIDRNICTLTIRVLALIRDIFLNIIIYNIMIIIRKIIRIADENMAGSVICALVTSAADVRGKTTVISVQ